MKRLDVLAPLNINEAMKLSPSTRSFIPAHICYDPTSTSSASQTPPHVLTQIPLHGSTVGSRTPTIPNLNYRHCSQSEGFPSEAIRPFLTNIPRDFLFRPSSPNPPRHSPPKPHNMTGEDGLFDNDSPDVSSGVASPLSENAEPLMDNKKEVRRSSVYNFYSALDANGTWDPIKHVSRFTYRCNHCTRSISVIGRNTSNLNKHRSRCPGRQQAWALRAPGAIDPQRELKMATDEMQRQQQLVVECIVSAQLPFTIFEDARFRQILNHIAPRFDWPRRKQIAGIAKKTYYQKKASLLKTLQQLPENTWVCAAIDAWTTKDQRQSYLAVVIQWIHEREFVLNHRLIAFENIDGDHSGQALASCFWDAMEERGLLDRVYSIPGDNASSNITMAQHLQHKFQAIGSQWPGQERYHRCACHVICLVVKDFLKSMGQLTDEDYEYFDHYWSNQQFPIAESDYESDTPILRVKSLKRKSSGPSFTKRSKARALNTATLETQQQSLNDLYHPSAEPTTLHVPSSPEDHALSNQVAGNPKRPISTVRALRELCSHIRGSSKQRQIFINIRDQTRDPKLLPLSIPMTRWNYFLKQVQRAQLLKNSIQLYTQTPHGSAYVLNDEVWASMEFMEPILQMFEGACNLFQREGPTKHLVLPIYNSLIKKLHHYACDSPPAWSQACHAAIDKIHKYKDHEMKNNDTLMATLLNPSYRQGMFKLIGLSPQRSQEVMDALSQEYLILTADSSPIGEDLRVSTSPCPNKDSPQRKLLKMYDCALQLTSSNPTQTGNMDEVFSYLQNQHPIMEGEDILKYWKRQMITGAYPELGKIALRYLSIPASSAAVERVFSQSGHLITPTRARMASKTIAHLCCLKEWLKHGDK